MSNQKFRPYFTASELTEVIRCLKTGSANKALIRYLETFAIKIEHGVMAANITLKPTIAEKLGMADRLPGTRTLQEQRADAYTKWSQDPSKCTSQEIARCLMYRYENDLMSESEEREYEQKIERGY
jgi:hypothetical protein